MDDIMLEIEDEEVKKLTFKTRSFKETKNEDEEEENQKYAISVWKLNKGKEPQQISEYGFDEDPVNKRFYISQSGS